MNHFPKELLGAGNCHTEGTPAPATDVPVRLNFENPQKSASLIRVPAPLHTVGPSAPPTGLVAASYPVMLRGCDGGALPSSSKTTLDPATPSNTNLPGIAIPIVARESVRVWGRSVRWHPYRNKQRLTPEYGRVVLSAPSLRSNGGIAFSVCAAHQSTWW